MPLEQWTFPKQKAYFFKKKKKKKKKEEEGDSVALLHTDPILHGS